MNSDGDDSNYYLNDISAQYAVDKCIHTHSFEYGFMDDDIEGNPRPKGNAFDRGAYEKRYGDFYTTELICM